MDNLYVHLQSDSSPEFFPNNTICDFRNQLAGSLDIDPAFYEVALVQCSYVYNPPCIKAGKEVAKLHVHGSVVDFHDTVRSTVHVFSDQLDNELTLIEQNTFMLSADELSGYQNKTGDFTKISNLNSYNKSSGLYRITEQTIECRLERTTENFHELLSYVNEKLAKYNSSITYDKVKILTFDIHKDVKTIEFLGTYDGMFNKKIPIGWYNGNKKNIVRGSSIF